MAEPTRDELTLLALLARGGDFSNIVYDLGGEGPRAAFSALQKGWVNQGHITPLGRQVVKEALKPPTWIITVLPLEKPEPIIPKPEEPKVEPET